MAAMMYLWIVVMFFGMVMRSDIIVAVSIVHINLLYVADKIIKRIEKAAK